MKKPLLLLTVMLMAVTMMAQNQARISIQVSGKPLDEVFTEIQNLSGFTFFYSRDAVAMQKKVDFTASKEPAKEVITRLLTQQGVNFTINGTDVIVLAEAVKKDKVTVSGTVIDDMGYPLPGGGVIVAGTTQGVVTDIDPQFPKSFKKPFNVCRKSIIPTIRLSLFRTAKNVSVTTQFGLTVSKVVLRLTSANHSS